MVGVIFAVALLPPLVVFGILLGAGHWEPALGAFSLLMIHIICINLTGVVTFVIQGIKPYKWGEAGKAKKTSRFAISFWILLLLLLTFALYFSHLNFEFL